MTDKAAPEQPRLRYRDTRAATSSRSHAVDRRDADRLHLRGWSVTAPDGSPWSPPQAAEREERLTPNQQRARAATAKRSMGVDRRNADRLQRNGWQLVAPADNPWEPQDLPPDAGPVTKYGAKRA